MPSKKIVKTEQIEKLETLENTVDSESDMELEAPVIKNQTAALGKSGPIVRQNSELLIEICCYADSANRKRTADWVNVESKVTTGLENQLNLVYYIAPGRGDKDPQRK